MPTRSATALHNSAALVRWNSDKRYLARPGPAGIPVVETTFVGPGEPVPALDGEVVVEARRSRRGGRDSGRFGPAAHGLARDLVEAIHAERPHRDGAAVSARASTRVGETAVLCIDGEPVHALRKGAVLRPGRGRPDPRRRGSAPPRRCTTPTLVTPGEAGDDELELAREVVAEVGGRFELPAALRARRHDPRRATARRCCSSSRRSSRTSTSTRCPATAAVVADAIIARAAG